MGLDLGVTMDALGVKLATIVGLRVHDYPPDAIVPPSAVISYPDAVEYDRTYAGGCDSAVFTVHVIVGAASARASRDAIALYVGRAGSVSIKTVLEADPTLGGAVKSLRVERVTIETMTIGGAEYLGAAYDVEVYA